MTAMLRAIEGFCVTSRLPIYDQRFAGQDADDALHVLRIRARDTILEAYDEYGGVVLRKLVDLAVDTSAQSDLPMSEVCSRVEPPLYYLETLSDTLAEIPSEDAAIAKLFDSVIYAHLVNAEEAQVPLELKKLALSTIRVSKKFFIRHEQYLHGALFTLSRSLHHSDLSQTAASLIAYVCDWNRRRLIPHLGEMQELIKRYYQSSYKKNTGKVYMCRAIASVIQALPSEEQKAAQLRALLHFVDQDFKSEISTLNPDSDESARVECARSALLQIDRIAKACQTPDDTAIDLEAEKDTYWSSGDGSNVQKQILSILREAVQVDPLEAALLEEACSVLRHGYAERNSGPFVFDPSVTPDFIYSIPVEHPRVDIAVNLSCSFISSRSSESSRANEQASSLLIYVYRVIEHLGNPRNDPFVAQACMDFLGRLVPFYIQELFVLPQDELLGICHFSMHCLNSPETWPRRSAATFWESIIHTRDQPADVLSKLDELVALVGPSLTLALVHCFGGDCTRSEVERLSGAFREIVFSQKMAKQWIQAALEDPSFPSHRVSDEDKRFFLQQVMSLRGSAKTKTVVKDFWVACRGTPTGYG